MKIELQKKNSFKFKFELGLRDYMFLAGLTTATSKILLAVFYDFKDEKISVRSI